MFGRSKQQKMVVSSVSAANRKTMNPSVIASNMSVLGNIVSDGILDIDGCVDGNVRAFSVTLRVNGKIRGDVMAEEVFVYGEVDGLIKAQNVTLYDGAKVKGTIMHESLTVEDGASVDGKLKRSERMFADDQRAADRARPLMSPSLDSNFDNDNDEPQSEAELRVLENLRLIS